METINKKKLLSRLNTLLLINYLEMVRIYWVFIFSCTYYMCSMKLRTNFDPYECPFFFLFIVFNNLLIFHLTSFHFCRKINVYTNKQYALSRMIATNIKSDADQTSQSGNQYFLWRPVHILVRTFNLSSRSEGSMMPPSVEIVPNSTQQQQQQQQHSRQHLQQQQRLRAYLSGTLSGRYVFIWISYPCSNKLQMNFDPYEYLFLFNLF